MKYPTVVCFHDGWFDSENAAKRRVLAIPLVNNAEETARTNWNMPNGLPNQVSLVRIKSETKINSRIILVASFSRKDVLVKIWKVVYQSELTAEMITIFIHQMVTISSEIFTQLGNNPRNVFLCEICISDVNGLSIQNKRGGITYADYIYVWYFDKCP